MTAGRVPGAADGLRRRAEVTGVATRQRQARWAAAWPRTRLARAAEERSAQRAEAARGFIAMPLLRAG